MDSTRPRWADHLAVFDLETTGIDTTTCRIVSAYVGEIDAEGTVVAKRSWLLDPGVEIPAGASAVHGITTERARREGQDAASGVAEIAQCLRDVLGRGIPVVIYNAPYDLSVLARECARHSVPALDGPAPIVDPLVIDKAVDRYRRGKRTLSAAADVYGVSLEDAHDASADAIAAGRVAQALAAQYDDDLRTDADALHTLQVQWCREQAESYTRWRRDRGEADFTSSGAWPIR